MTAPTLALSRNREFAALWIGQTISQFGTSLSAFAYPLLVLTLTGSAAQAGLVGTVLGLTTFLLRLPAGAWTDRVDRRRLMLISDAGRVAAVISIPVADAVGHLTVAQILAVAVVEGTLGVFFGPAEAAAVRWVVPGHQVRQAVARNQIRSQVAGLLGPTVGGFLFSVGRAVPFVGDAVSYAISFLCVLTVRTPLQEAAGPPGRRHLLAEIREGLSRWWQDRFLRATAIWLAGAGAIYSSIGLVTLVLARDAGATVGELGVMFTVTAAGGFIGAFLAPWLRAHVRPGLLVVVFGWTGAAAAATIVVLRSPYALGVAGAVAFLLVPAINAVVFGHLAATVPDRLQGRVHSAVLQVSMVLTPVGPVVAGLLLDGAGPVRTAGIYAAALAVLAIVATATRAIRAATNDGSSRTRRPPGRQAP
jgi:predicted MFS family arabinose efflux permease